MIIRQSESNPKQTKPPLPQKKIPPAAAFLHLYRQYQPCSSGLHRVCDETVKL